jgi:hypothetical protein
MLRGEYEQARTFLQKNTADHEKTGDRIGYLRGRARLGEIVLGEGKIDEARRILVNVIDNLYADQNKNGLAFALDRMAHIFVITNSPEAAAHLIGWSDANRRIFGASHRAG